MVFRESEPPAAPERVLIVRPSALGDVSRTVPVAVSLKRRWPGASVHWLVNRGFEAVIEAHPAVDAVVSFPRRELAGFGRRGRATRRGLAFAGELRRGRYDVVYDVQGLARSGLLTWLTRAPRRVGFADARELGWLGSNVRRRVPPGARHAVDRMLSLLEADGVEPVRDLSLSVPPGEASWLEGFLEGNGLRGGYVAVAPTARWASKCWPAERFAEVTARVLAARPDWKAVVLASPDERERAGAMLRALGARGVAVAGEGARAVAPETSVGGLMAILSRCGLLVCNDSAPLHIAVGLGRPIAAVFGPTDPERVGPYGRGEAVARPEATPGEWVRYARDRRDPTLIERVGVEAVWRIAEREMRRGSG